MKWIALALAGLLLSACGGNICWHDHSGLSPPPWDSTVPKPH
jgi:hypothetical protein